jgi:hypothetical protein
MSALMKTIHQSGPCSIAVVSGVLIGDGEVPKLKTIVVSVNEGNAEVGGVFSGNVIGGGTTTGVPCYTR